MSRPNLGKGLSALLSENIGTLPTQELANTSHLPIDDIVPGMFQPRREFDDEELNNLIQSVREKGVIQPLVVRPIPNGRYEIIAGERRWRASKVVGLNHVPVVIRACSDDEALECALIENIQRDNLNPMEEAEGYQRLIDQFGYSQEKVALKVGKSRSYIANLLRLNTLPYEVKDLVRQKKLSASHARTLVGTDDAVQKARLLIDNNLSVREAEQLAKKPLEEQKTRIHVGPSDLDEQSDLLRNQFQKLLGLKTNLNIKKTGAQLTIYFQSLEEIDELLEKLNLL